GPKTKHAYHPDAKREVERRMESLARRGRVEARDEVTLVTYTLKYNRMSWVTIDALGEHWKRARVHAGPGHDGGFEVQTENVDALTLDFPAGRYPGDLARATRVTIDGTELVGPRPLSDRSFSFAM